MAWQAEWRKVLDEHNTAQYSIRESIGDAFLQAARHGRYLLDESSKPPLKARVSIARWNLKRAGGKLAARGEHTS
jgi:hypothetical protein